MAEATATTRPARKRTASATKTAPAKATPKAAPVAETEEVEMAKFPFAMDAQDETKGYAVFTPPASSGCVGKLYAPKGTVEIKVLLIGPAS